MILAYRPGRIFGLMASTGSGVTGAERIGGGEDKYRAAKSASVTAATGPGRPGRLLTAAAGSCRTH